MNVGQANNRVESRLRDALAAVGTTVEPARLRPLIPPKRRGFRPRVRFVAVGLGLALAGAVGAVLLAPSERETVMVATGASSLLSGGWTKGQPEIAVFLCHDGSPLPACGAVTEPDGGGSDGVRPAPATPGTGITAAQQSELEQVLRARPEVKSITFEDRRTAYANVRRHLLDSGDRKLADALAVGDVPESFRLTMKPDTDWGAVTDAVKDMPGVAAVIDQKCVAEQAVSDRARCTAE
ncbi:permease-like cell division protein FtsX [Nonomuraea muscovyensis]|uniref:permease-like cell division protein FtsX n=1 Tax=Nonomuraea muscovyensis TaxID=1124761 RepID=UPI0033F210FE